MKTKFNLKLGMLGAILIAMMAVPALAQQKQGAGAQTAKQAPATGMKTAADVYKQMHQQMIAELKLSPAKEKAVLAVGDKFTAKRQATIEAIKKAHEELGKALAAPKPDEAKVKKLVDTLLSGQDEIFNSFRTQRNEELALMTPVEQGKYLMEMGKMRQELMEKAKKPPTK